MLLAVTRFLKRDGKSEAFIQTTSDHDLSGHVSVCDSECTAETMLIDDTDGDSELTRQFREYMAKAAAEEKKRYFEHLAKQDSLARPSGVTDSLAPGRVQAQAPTEMPRAGQPKCGQDGRRIPMRTLSCMTQAIPARREMDDVASALIAVPLHAKAFGYDTPSNPLTCGTARRTCWSRRWERVPDASEERIADDAAFVARALMKSK